jgi:uncharacterized protein YjbI with pentapeptide repeats
VSFGGSSQAMAGAFAMSTFFDSERYQGYARTVAGSLMPMVDNTGGFDDVLTEMARRTNNDSQNDLIDIGQSLSALERMRWDQMGHANKTTYSIPFVQPATLEVDFLTPAEKRKAEDTLNIAAYELDSVSNELQWVWTNGKGISPKGQDLTNVVLENHDFSGLDFSGATLESAVLANASFKNAHFSGADFNGANLIFSYSAKLPDDRTDGVHLEGADLCGVKEFDGSDWSGADWWDAKCISPELFGYVSKNYAPPSAAQLEKARKAVPQ